MLLGWKAVVGMTPHVKCLYGSYSEPFLFICYIAREVFLLLVFAKSIFHFYSKNYTDVGRTLQTLLADAKWCVCKSYCCSKLSFKCYWIPLLTSKYLGETPVNSDDRLNHSFMKVANPLEMSCVFLQYILFLPSLSDDNAFGCVFKTKVF